MEKIQKSKKKLRYLIRVFEDNTAEILEGKALEEYVKKINSALVLTWLHGGEELKDEWKLIKVRIEKIKNK